MCTTNVTNDFGRSSVQIHPKELELKLEHQGIDAFFLNLEINLVDRHFVHKLQEESDPYTVFIARVSNTNDNMPSTISYLTFVNETFRIFSSTLRFMNRYQENDGGITK